MPRHGRTSPNWLGKCAVYHSRCLLILPEPSSQPTPLYGIWRICQGEFVRTLGHRYRVVTPESENGGASAVQSQCQTIGEEKEQPRYKWLAGRYKLRVQHRRTPSLPRQTGPEPLIEFTEPPRGSNQVPGTSEVPGTSLGPCTPRRRTRGSEDRPRMTSTGTNTSYTYTH